MLDWPLAPAAGLQTHIQGKKAPAEASTALLLHYAGAKNMKMVPNFRFLSSEDLAQTVSNTTVAKTANQRLPVLRVRGWIHNIWVDCLLHTLLRWLLCRPWAPPPSPASPAGKNPSLSLQIYKIPQVPPPHNTHTHTDVHNHTCTTTRFLDGF